MSEERIRIDSDWKSEAAKEKEMLASQESRGGKPTAGAHHEAQFLELVELLVMQAAVAMGGMQGAGGQRIPANLPAARHFIDLLELLDAKTKGNLTDDEQKALTTVLYELRMQFVETARPVNPANPVGGTPLPG